jgi:acetate---CoA ligase (ADP-forming)
VVKPANGVGHKSDQGLVTLNLRLLSEVERAASEMWRSLGSSEPLLLQKQMRPGVEVLLGARHDSDWGPILVIGAGGVQSEVWNDVAILSLPVSASVVKQALARLRIWTLLQGFRGAPSADLQAVCDAAANFGRAYVGGRWKADVEINPLIVHEVGKGVVAVDVTGWNQK